MSPMKLEAPQWISTAEAKVFDGLAHLKTAWKIWNLRSLILVSLGLQVILILFAPFRKKTSNTIIVITIWLSYLLADYIDIQAVGIIPKYSTTAATSATHPDLLSFWSPFLLVHLGGPDPITALSLEDNELWLRTALHFFTYISATGRNFFQSLPVTLLSIPTTLMFCAGFFKYLERTLSLYNACLTQFKASLLTDQDFDLNNQYDLSESFHSHTHEQRHYNFDDGELSVKNNVKVAVVNREYNEDDISSSEDYNNNSDDNNVIQRRRLNCFPFLSLGLERSNVILVLDAYMFFDKYKGVYGDLTFSLHDRDKSRAYFLQPTLKLEDAFTVLAIELNFTYEVFYTKMIVIHQTFGTWIRRVSFLLELTSLFIWTLFIDMRPLHKSDIWITYTLLVGAVLIDSAAYLSVALSDWRVAKLTRDSKIRVSLYDKLLAACNRTWGDYWGPKEATWWPLLKRLFCRRWSESVFQFSMIDYCTRPSSNFDH